MHRHWRRCGPPAYVGIALYLGLAGADRPSRETVNDPDDLANLLGALPGGRRD